MKGFINPATMRSVELAYESPAPPRVDAGNNPARCSVAPTVNAGADDTFFGTSGSLTGSASSVCPLLLTHKWTKLSGPGSVVFDDGTSLSTDFTVDALGTYAFRLTVSDGHTEVHDDVQRVAISTPSIAMSCESESGTATMCGFNEFVSPSTPPKKYRKQTFSGTAKFSFWGTGNNTCAGAPQCDSILDTFSGIMQYDEHTCAASGTGVRTRAGSGPCPSFVENVTAVNLYDAAWSGTQASQTVFRLTGLTTCQVGPGSTSSLLWHYTPTAQQELSDEDTAADALARASSTPGTSCTAAREPRGASDFVFNFVAVAYEMQATSGLVNGIAYRFIVDLTEEVYGGGSPVVTEKTYDFVASGPSHSVIDGIDCLEGKQVTVSNLRIELQ